MRIAIVGSREIEDYDFVRDAFVNAASAVMSPRPWEQLQPVIVSGGAKGVDSIAQRIASDYNFDFVCYEPYFVVDQDADYSARHFFVRNRQIVKNSDLVLAFPKGESKGTRHTIQYAIKKGVDTLVYEYPDE